MRTHDDRPGGEGGYPDDRNFGGTSSAGAGSQGPAGLDGYDYYDDDAGYSDGEGTSLIRGRSDDYYEELERESKQLRWNAGADLGLLVLRLALGGLFIVHGAQKLFGAFGGPGPDGFAQALSRMGFRESAVLSLVTGGTELGAGALLVLGLFTPLAAAGLLGVMASAVVTKLDSGFFAAQGGFEFEAVLGVAALALMFTGPGRVALDKGRSWFRHPLVSGFVALLIAAGSSAAVLLLLR
ncbi:DoxX family protein [Parasphingorhabdus pacifica]